MLSSVASRCFWTGRYLERAENTARLVEVYSTLLLDLPRESGVSWQQLISICGADINAVDATAGPGSASDHESVAFMVADAANPASILFSVAQARENLRTLREVMPREGFKLINEFHLYAKSNLQRANKLRGRQEVLGEVVRYCQQITGLFSGTMSHNETYQFLKLGRNLERADMTTRVLDVAGELLDGNPNDLGRHETTLWVNVLRSTSGYQAYRQQIRSRITPTGVLYFLLTDEQFPRAVAHCLNKLQGAVATLPDSAAVEAEIDKARDALSKLSLRNMVRETLHQEMDNMQLGFNQISESIENTWFPAPEEDL